MEDLDKEIKKIFLQDIELSYKYKNMVRNTLKNKRKNINYIFRNTVKFATTTFACIIVMTSIVFAKDISILLKHLFNNKSEGIDSAIENGYILQPDMKYIESSGAEAKVDNLLMDDSNLSFTINLKFKEEILVSEINKMSLLDMIIVDDENKILYCQNKEMFNQYCIENHFELEYKNFNDYNINSGSNCFIKNKNIQDNSLALVYNLYANNFPKSKQLKIYFKQIEIEKNNNENLTIVGEWKLNIEIPKKFYNREAIVYKVKKCSNPKINVTEAIVYNTCMKLSLDTQEELIYELGDSEEIINNKIRDKIDKKYQDFLSKSNDGNFDDAKLFSNKTYVETENGTKFYPSENSSEDGGYSEDYMTGEVLYWQTYNLTKYDTTNNLKVFLNYKDEDILIELEK